MYDAEHDATYIPPGVKWPRSSDSNRSALWHENFEKGRRNAEEHMQRMLTTRDPAGCPCLGCSRRSPKAELMFQ